MSVRRGLAYVLVGWVLVCSPAAFIAVVAWLVGIGGMGFALFVVASLALTATLFYMGAYDR